MFRSEAGSRRIAGCQANPRAAPMSPATEAGRIICFMAYRFDYLTNVEQPPITESAKSLIQTISGEHWQTLSNIVYHWHKGTKRDFFGRFRTISHQNSLKPPKNERMSGRKTGRKDAI